MVLALAWFERGCRGRHFYAGAAAAADLPSPGRPARRIPAHHVRAAVHQPRAAAWWPAVIGLEQVMDAITAAGLAASRGGSDIPADGVQRLCDALRAVSEAALTGTELAAVPGLPDDETLKPVSEAIRALLGVLGPGQRLTLQGL